MTEIGEVSKQETAFVEDTVEFEWSHPKNGCIKEKTQPIIRQSFTAAGNTNDEAQRFARVLGENEIKICNTCKEDYIRII